MAYFLGVMATDGCVYNDSVRIFVQSKDKKWIRKVLSIVDKKRKLRCREINTRQYYGFCITQQGLQDAFHTWGIGPNKSHTIEFPNHIPSHLMSSFVRGCFDGDGSISFKRKGKPGEDRYQSYVQSVKFCSGSLAFTEGLQVLLKEEGIASSISTEARKPPRSDLYSLRILVESYEDFYQYLYHPSGGTCLLRKKSLFSKMLTYRRKYTAGYQRRHRRLHDKLTKEYFMKCKDKSTGKIPVAQIAKRLKIHTSTVYSRMRKLGISNS
jgi:hypothetical protein